jgi:hypothetical protein
MFFRTSSPHRKLAKSNRNGNGRLRFGSRNTAQKKGSGRVHDASRRTGNRPPNRTRDFAGTALFLTSRWSTDRCRLNRFRAQAKASTEACRAREGIPGPLCTIRREPPFSFAVRHGNAPPISDSISTVATNGNSPARTMRNTNRFLTGITTNCASSGSNRSSVRQIKLKRGTRNRSLSPPRLPQGR